MKTKIFIGGDFHTGHLLGLTPKELVRPNFKLEGLVCEFWDWFISKLKTYDIAILGGDLIDGPGKKDNSHLLLPSTQDQIKTSIDIIKLIKAKKYLFVYGSGYHVGQDRDDENDIALHFGGDIKTTQRISVQGINFEISHKIGKSGVPGGGDIALRNKAIWNVLSSLGTDSKQVADWILFFHAHEYRRIETDWNNILICPCMKLGIADYERYARGLSGYYSVGFIEMEITDGIVTGFEKHKFFYEVDRDYREVL